MSKKSFLFYLCTLGFVFIIIFSSFLKNERLSYCEYEDFDIRNESVEYSTYFDLSQGNLQQGFIAPGNRLTKVFLFFDKNSVIDVTAEVRDATGTKSLFSKTISKQGENSIGWQEFEFDFNGLKRGTEYLLCLKAKEHAFVAVIPERDSADDLLTELSFKEQTCPGALALKIQFSYQHYSPSKIVHMIMELLFRFFEVGMLCWAVGHIQMLWTFFLKERRKRSILPALYFTIKLLFQVNPLELSRLCVQKFNRIIGIGIIADVDVVRRISNFYFWFAGFALFFCLFYLLFNYYTPINCEGDRKAISTLYEDFVVIGIVQLFFQGVSFFNKQESLSVEFNYSQGIIILLLFAMIMYMAFHMEKRISSDSYLKNIVIGISLGWVISIIWPSFWNNGEILLFAQGCVLLVLILIAIYLPGLRSKVINLISWDFVVCAASMLPFGISFYIELLNIFNQHGIFVGNPWLLFIIIVNLFFLAVIFVARFLKKGFWHYSQWKNWCFPWLVFGIACLSVQIPLQTIYSADFFEFANFSIPISDFFLKGKIPILENYGGHMMSGVWEGLIYGFVNGDIKGAIFSPYSVYI